MGLRKEVDMAVPAEVVKKVKGGFEGIILGGFWRCRCGSGLLA